MATAPNTERTGKVYDFRQYLKRANEMSLRKPSDVVLFCELIYGAAISHKANKDLMEVVTNSFKDPLTSGQFSKAWKYAQNCHTNFYEMKNMKERLKQNILNSVGDMNDLIEKADIDMIKHNLGPLKKIKPENETPVNIGSETFMYNRSASWQK